MFRCECCGRIVPPRTPSTRLVAGARPVTYPRREKAQRAFVQRNGKRLRGRHDDPGGHGWEIVREIRTCPDCAISDAPDGRGGASHRGPPRNHQA